MHINRIYFVKVSNIAWDKQLEPGVFSEAKLPHTETVVISDANDKSDAIAKAKEMLSLKYSFPIVSAEAISWNIFQSPFKHLRN